MKKKISILIIGLIIILASLGLSYAYWKITLMGDKGNNVTSGCFNIEMINQKDEITLGSTFPITDAEGLKLKPFSFTLKNTCTIFAHYYVNMEMLEGTTLNSRFVAIRVNNEAINTLDTYKVANTTINTSTESRTIAEGYLGADEEVDYTVSFWMDEDATIDDDVMNKVFKSKIVINSEPGKYDPVSAGYDTLHDAILANEYQTTPEIAKTKIANKQEVDLSQTAPVIKWVEKAGESTTQQVIKPTAEAISSVPELSDLSSDEQYMYICTTKSFNSDTAKYTLSDCSLKDPTTLDYSKDTKYYYIDDSLSYKDGKFFVPRHKESVTIYSILSAAKIIEYQSIENITLEANIYNLSCVALTTEELETDKSDKGIYQADDDYGTTYYYRGNVKNNNVYFAGFFWQIIRINGDGSIRLIYNGTNGNIEDKHITIGDSPFNGETNSPANVGYMYGSVEGQTFSELHANTESSSIKITVDNWYEKNMIKNGFANYISNSTGFCGDRTLYNGDGISTSTYSYFGAYARYDKNTALFTCQNASRDLYTTSNSNFGNKSLTYPVGLITYDELVFAGMNKTSVNKFSWVYYGKNYWTMSASYYGAFWHNATVMLQGSSGVIEEGWSVGSSNGIRPVINLKPDVKITGGTGTANDPFVVDTNN